MQQNELNKEADEIVENFELRVKQDLDSVYFF